MYPHKQRGRRRAREVTRSGGWDTCDMWHVARRRAKTMGAGVAVLTLVSMGAGARAAGPVEPGQGVAAAQTVKFDPKAGGLSLGITFGQAIGAHQNLVAQATSQAINLGVIGSTI